MVSTADVRPIGEVIEELARILARDLSLANPPVLAVWETLGQCQQFLLDDHEQRAQSTDPADRLYRMKRATEHAVASGIIRRVANAYGVSTFRAGVKVDG